MKMFDKKNHFKLFAFEEMSLEELEKIRQALYNLGYRGKLIDNGNIIFSSPDFKDKQ